MQNLGQELIRAADQNRMLLQVLSQTDYSLSSLKQNTLYINDLETRLAETDNELTLLHAITDHEHKDHIKYRDSTVKRFAYKLGGQKGKDKFVSKAGKEEREFLEAWQAERETKAFREELSRALEQARHDRESLEADRSRNDSAQTELDGLYRSIFGGPTPELPHEDQMEETVLQSSEHFNQCQSQLGNEKHALEALRHADGALQNARNAIQEAHSASTWDVMGGGTFADMMERSALSQAQMAIHQTKQHMLEARRAQPAVQPLSAVKIDDGHLFSDVVFDNIFSDMAQHERILKSESEIEQAISASRKQIREQRQRKQMAEEQVKQAADGLELARLELQKIRADAFESYVRGIPPTYQA